MPFAGDTAEVIKALSSQGTFEQVITTAGGGADDVTDFIRSVGRPYIAAVVLWVGGGSGVAAITVRVEFIHRNTWRTLDTLTLAAAGSRVRGQWRMPARRVRLVVVDPNPAVSAANVLVNFGVSGT